MVIHLDLRKGENHSLTENGERDGRMLETIQERRKRPAVPGLSIYYQYRAADETRMKRDADNPMAQSDDIRGSRTIDLLFMRNDIGLKILSAIVLLPRLRLSYFFIYVKSSVEPLSGDAARCMNVPDEFFIAATSPAARSCILMLSVL